MSRVVPASSEAIGSGAAAGADDPAPAAGRVSRRERVWSGIAVRVGALERPCRRRLYANSGGGPTADGAVSAPVGTRKYIISKSLLWPTVRAATPS
jgi:hypothetical protein